MRRLFQYFLGIAVGAMLMPMGARASEIRTDSLRSEILNATVKYNVYLPGSFGKSEKTYPVIYLLHGLTDTHEAWAQKGQLQTVVDELIGTGEVCEVVIIMPCAGGPDTHNIQNGYFNVPGWNYEDFFFTELMPQLEEKYRCVSDKEHRAVMGLSMGGGGSTVYCQHHPEVFSSCYAMSAWLDTPEPELGEGMTEEDCLYKTCKSVHENSTLDFLRNADEATKERLRSVKWFFDCGDDDFLLKLSMDIHILMREAWIKDEFRVKNGVHNWEYWHLALRDALPFATRNFGK